MPRNRHIFSLSDSARKLPFAALALFACYFLIAALVWASTPESNRNRQNAGPRYVALSFDDGPTAKHTPAVLQILAREHVPATFFVLGRQVKLYPEIVRQEAAQGHAVALHGYSHTDIRTLSASELNRELNDSADLIRRAGVQFKPYFRPPWGYATDKEIRTVESAGYSVVMWTLGIESVLAPTPQQMVTRLMQRLGDRQKAVILLHDGFDLDRTTTVQALPLLIDKLRAAGFTFVPLERLMDEVVRHPAPGYASLDSLRVPWPYSSTTSKPSTS